MSLEFRLAIFLVPLCINKPKKKSENKFEVRYLVFFAPKNQPTPPLGQTNIFSKIDFIELGYLTHVSEDISAPHTRINLPIALLEPCCQAYI